MMSLLEIGWPPTRYTSAVPFGIGGMGRGEAWVVREGGGNKSMNLLKIMQLICALSLKKRNCSK